MGLRHCVVNQITLCYFVPMDVESAQALAVEYYRTDRQWYPGALERLVDAFLRDVGDDDWCSKFPNFTDGVLFDLSEAEPDQFNGHGTAYIIGNKDHVEPISVQMRFNPTVTEVTEATIKFGIGTTKTSRPGSPTTKTLVQSVLAKATSTRPKFDFEWKYEFRLLDGKWSSERAD